MKRGRLEEAKAPEEANRTGEEGPRCQPTSQWSKPIAASTSSKNILQRDLVRRRNAIMHNILLSPSNAKASEVQLVSAFWECYIPSGNSAQAGSPCAWLQQSICLPDPPPALRLSLNALAMTKLGWIRNDDTFVRGGRVIYGNALRELQKTLYHERSILQDETMATCNALALYEVSEFTMDHFPPFSSDFSSCPSLHRRQ